MKNFLKSSLIALLLLGATAVSQASHTITGPNVLGTSLFGYYEGHFTAAGRTLPFNWFYMTVYPNGYMTGYLSGNDASASFSGMVDKKGTFDATFWYGDKYYTLKGLVNKSKKAVAVAKPYRKNNTVGTLNGTLSRTSYAPSSLYNNSEYYISGNGVDLYFEYYDDGTFYGYDYNNDEEFEGDYSYTKLGNNLARLTLYAEDGAHVFLLYFFGNGYGVAYDVGNGTFHQFYDGSED